MDVRFFELLCNHFKTILTSEEERTREQTNFVGTALRLLRNTFEMHGEVGRGQDRETPALVHDRVFKWAIDSQIDWLIDWLFENFTNRGLFGRLIDWLIDCSIAWLITAVQIDVWICWEAIQKWNLRTNEFGSFILVHWRSRESPLSYCGWRRPMTKGILCWTSWKLSMHCCMTLILKRLDMQGRRKKTWKTVAPPSERCVPVKRPLRKRTRWKSPPGSAPFHLSLSQPLFLTFSLFFTLKATSMNSMWGGIILSCDDPWYFFSSSNISSFSRRHSSFGGSFTMRGSKAVNPDNEVVLLKPVSVIMNNAFELTGDKQTKAKAGKRRAMVSVQERTGGVEPLASEALRTFCTRFITVSYNVFMHNAKVSKQFTSRISLYSWLIDWFAWWLVVLSSIPLIDWLIDPLIVDRLIDRLIDWLQLSNLAIGWLEQKKNLR